MITFYCGVSETVWNHHPVRPGPFACVSPVYGSEEDKRRKNPVAVPVSTRVIQDSGAFSDGPQSRLSVEEAWRRQVEHGQEFGYAGQITHRASYDLLIDEKWQDGKRFKARWSETDARAAVKVTVDAARFMTDHRDTEGVILSAQGVMPKQYADCVRQILPMLTDADMLGLGGWCITGKMPAQMLPVFRDTIAQVVPMAAMSGVRRIHIWGVLLAPAIGELLYLCNEHGIALSTDSSGPSTRPAMGTWGYMGWRKKDYKRPPVEVRGVHRAIHVVLTRCWLNQMERTQYYRHPETERPYQLAIPFTM